MAHLSQGTKANICSDKPSPEMASGEGHLTQGSSSPNPPPPGLTMRKAPDKSREGDSYQTPAPSPAPPSRGTKNQGSLRNSPSPEEPKET